MTEPTYSYIKGQGWVASTCESPIVTMACGKCVRLEWREPDLGEHWDSAPASTDYWYLNKPNWETWKHTFERLSYDRLMKTVPIYPDRVIVAVPL